MAPHQTEAGAGFPDWGIAIPRAAWAIPIAKLVALPAVAAGLVGILGGPGAGAGAGLAVAAALGALVAAGPRRLLTREGAARADAGEEPRLMNLVAGISRDLGMEAPEVWIAPGPPNAAALHLSTPIVCLRRDLVDGSTRTELEGAVAFLLAGIHTGAARAATFPRWISSSSAIPDPLALDVAAVSVTRYPPALAGVVQRCEAHDAALGLWLVGGPAGERPRDERVAALQDL